MSRFVLAVIGAGALLCATGLPALAAEGSVPDPGSIIPAACDAGHGAFTYFADPSLHFTSGQPPYFGDNVLGSARGGATGAVNSDYSASCNS